MQRQYAGAFCKILTLQVVVFFIFSYTIFQHQLFKKDIFNIISYLQDRKIGRTVNHNYLPFYNSFLEG